MKRETLISWVAFLLTFLWLLLPDTRNSLASLWPSILAIGLAFLTRNIYTSLFAGALAGALLLHGGNPCAAFLELFSKHLITSLKDPWNLNVLIFTLMMGGLVELLQRNGGTTALAEWFLGRAHSKRKAGMGAYLLGWVIFIDGLANSMLVGKAMRPITDKARISRAKLAFIVDSTSSPIAGLAVISTWVAYELSVIKQGFEQTPNLAAEQVPAAFTLLVQSLPYRFYNWFLLLLVFLVIWLGRDIGPMVKAEQEAAAKATEAMPEPIEVKADKVGSRLHLALVPIVVLVLGVFAGLFIQGGGLERELSVDSLIAALGAADAAIVFVWVTAFTCLLTMILSALRPTEEMKEGVIHAFFEGMKQLFLPTMILVFAWVLNSVIKDLGAAKFLASLLSDRMPAGLLPAVVFITASLISFSTGTSWGTMALVMPLAIPLAVTLGGAPNASVVVVTIGAVLAGAVFGDHCSPISDTTIVSAFASDCDAMEHVRTQMPYALLAAGIGLVVGYLPTGFGLTPWLALVLGGALCWFVLWKKGTATH
ncbi:MAG TPA: Na+/H+ antiporter NhaC family protein [Verrucomicrobiae bacterium]